MLKEITCEDVKFPKLNYKDEIKCQFSVPIHCMTKILILSETALKSKHF